MVCVCCARVKASSCVGQGAERVDFKDVSQPRRGGMAPDVGPSARASDVTPDWESELLVSRET